MEYVYKITNTVNGKAYIGISIYNPEKRRIKQHLSGYGNRLIERAIKKYGKDVFTYEILEANVLDEFLPGLEVAYIAKLNTVVPHGYNLTHGGNGGKVGRTFGKKIIEELHAAAFYLTKHPESTAEQVGAFVGKSKRTIERWSQTAEWHTALDNLGFTGDRTWRRKPQRDVERESGDLVTLAKTVYLNARAEGITRGKATIHTAKTINVSEKTIFNWRKRFQWEETTDEHIPHQQSRKL